MAVNGETISEGIIMDDTRKPTVVIAERTVYGDEPGEWIRFSGPIIPEVR